MENRRKCRLTSQIGYKTTLSPQVVAIPGLLLWKEFCVSSAASWRLNAVCSDYIKQGCVWVINPQWPNRWEVCVCGVLCVGLGGANSSGLWNKGFPFSLSLPLSLSLALFFLWVRRLSYRTSAVTLKIEQKAAELTDFDRHKKKNPNLFDLTDNKTIWLIVPFVHFALILLIISWDGEHFRAVIHPLAASWWWYRKKQTYFATEGCVGAGKEGGGTLELNQTIYTFLAHTTS